MGCSDVVVSKIPGVGHPHAKIYVHGNGIQLLHAIQCQKCDENMNQFYHHRSSH